MTRSKIERQFLPYDYQSASTYSFTDSVSIYDYNFWTMCKIKYNGYFLFFHKKTNLVFDERMNLLGRYIDNDVVVIEDLINKESIEHWMSECRKKPLPCYKEDDLEKLFEIV